MVRHVTRPCPCMTTSIIIKITRVISIWTIECNNWMKFWEFLRIPRNSQKTGNSVHKGYLHNWEFLRIQFARAVNIPNNQELLSVNDIQKAKEHCEKALTISRECSNRECEAKLYLSVGGLFPSFSEYDKAAYYLQKACSISSQIGHKMTEFGSLLCSTILKISQFEVVEALFRKETVNVKFLYY